VWRCTEDKTLPLTIQLGARCRQCDCSIDVLFRPTDMASKPERVRCPLCGRHEMKLLNAKVLA
jgi:hypothetical protein